MWPSANALMWVNGASERIDLPIDLWVTKPLVNAGRGLLNQHSHRQAVRKTPRPPPPMTQVVVAHSIPKPGENCGGRLAASGRHVNREAARIRLTGESALKWKR